MFLCKAFGQKKELYLYEINQKLNSLAQKHVIIVAGGIGTRMESSVPKQFLPLGKSIVLMYTIQAFFKAIAKINIVLVLPKNQIDYWNNLCLKYAFSIEHTIVDGGNSRFQSVKNGLSSIEQNSGLVAIHDGVRPLVNQKTIIDSFEYAKIHGSAIATIKPKDSMRKIVSNIETKSINRANYLLVQTPQTFDIQKLKLAYNQSDQPFFTDDSSVFECMGNQIFNFEGSYANIKITTPEDLIIAEILLNK